jgi:7,8-dihydropterin-6-yl-methyl-4-(beta-D-ribofuranosyl)aminobenzene 5'-phosphate synthase
LANKGLFVFTACSHAGLINVLTHAAERFPGIPLFGVLGGFRLAGPTEAIILETVDALEAFDLQLIAAAPILRRHRIRRTSRPPSRW